MNNPQTTLRIQYAALVIVAVLVVMGGAGAVMLLLGLSEIPWPAAIAAEVGLVSLVALLLVLCGQALANARNYRAHVLTDTAHRCQCLACGRTILPSGPPAQGKPSTQLTPQERLTSSRALQLGLGTMALASGLGLAGAIAAFATIGPGSVSPVMAIMAFGFLLLLLLVGLVVVWASKRRADGARRRLMHLPRDHGCACRWCHTEGRPAAQ